MKKLLVRFIIVKHLFFIVVFFTLSKCLFAETILEGNVTKIRDGDTIEVGQIAIRFQGLTCDELNTKKGREAHDLLNEILMGKRVVCELSGEMSYERLVGRCAVSEKGDIARYLIENGYCGRCNRYDKKGFYAESEKKSGPYTGVTPSYCH